MIQPVFKVLPVLKQDVVVVKPLDETKGGEVIIHKKEAVCRKCWKLIEENYGMKSNCQCEVNLIHSCCEAAWSGEHGGRCLYCKQEAPSIRVTLSRGQASESFQRKKKGFILLKLLKMGRQYSTCSCSFMLVKDGKRKHSS